MFHSIFNGNKLQTPFARFLGAQSLYCPLHVSNKTEVPKAIMSLQFCKGMGVELPNISTRLVSCNFQQSSGLVESRSVVCDIGKTNISNLIVETPLSDSYGLVCRIETFHEQSSYLE